MKTKCLFLVFIISLLCSCSASKTKATTEQIQALNQLVDGRKFTIESEWALPSVTNGMIAAQNVRLLAPGNSANRIHLLDQPNQLTIHADFVQAELPYFGEVQIPSGYMSSEDNNIIFDGHLKDYKAVRNNDNSYTLQFRTKSHSENFKVIIVVFPNLKTKMTLQGANRFPIQYSGRVLSSQ